MNDPKNAAANFLQRWSRRKRMAEAPPSGGTEPPESAEAEAGPPADAGAESPSDQPAFDTATLPPLDSITAATDIRAFLAPGVPEELTRAALRRAWTMDPAIRDFVGLAENQWDFTKPDGVPGFGSLEFTPELRRILARLIGQAAEPSPVGDKTRAQGSEELSRSAKEHTADGAHAAPVEPPTALSAADDAVVQRESKGIPIAPAPLPRRHGSALPK